MTDKQIKKLKLHMDEHLTLESEYQAHYSALNGRVLMTVHTERTDMYGGTGRVHTDFFVDHKHYETKDGFMDALRKLKL